MTVGLIRGEAANEVRTLAATGARAGTRRTIVAVTAGALALLGVVIGTAGAYLALVASYLEDLEPARAGCRWSSLLVTAIGVPLARRRGRVAPRRTRAAAHPPRHRLTPF